MNTEEEYVRLRIILEQVRYLKQLDFEKYVVLERVIEDNYYKK